VEGCSVVADCFDIEDNDDSVAVRVDRPGLFPDAHHRVGSAGPADLQPALTGDGRRADCAGPGDIVPGCPVRVDPASRGDWTHPSSSSCASASSGSGADPGARYLAPPGRCVAGMGESSDMIG